jgi:predicted dehydrogenase
MARSKSDRKLRVGVVGLGMGKWHINQYQQHPQAEVVAICDVDAARLDEAAAKFNIPQTYTDTKQMYRQAKLDIVSVATPNTLHAPLTIEALKAGCHVLCEKPMAMNAKQAQKMVDAAKAARRKLAINYSHRLTPNVAAMGQYIESGDIGQPYFARTIWHRRRGIPGRQSFCSKDSAGGGCLIDLGVHIIDIALYCLGFPKVLSVTGKTAMHFASDVPHLKMEVDDFATAYIRCAHDITLAVEVSWASHHWPGEEMQTSIYGTEGGLFRTMGKDWKYQITVSRREHGNLVTTTLDSFANVPSPPQDLVDAVLEKRPPQATGEHGLLLMKILDAIYKSSETGKEITVK